MFKKTLTAIGFLILSFTASAGLIDTTNDSFIDQTTGLEWMDFGVNNKDTYDYVASQLDTRDEYEGWRLATKDDVYSLYSNTFLTLTADYISHLDSYGRSTVGDGKNKSVSVLDNLFEKMGYNQVDNQGNAFEIKYATGLFQGDDGLSLFKTYDLVGSFRKSRSHDQVDFYDHMSFDYLSNNTSLVYSTMLVKNKSLATVPEPSTLTIFALGMFGLAARKFKKKN
ncbi:PEP-CTERM sorting domain-containing protein [Colwellia psychrerythraea]|uniref:Ice-binding protein C-terminal domain-containing protein n=1 Tax=Colwellia psychrerythraea (strain 34H / ATCC BAA-681) TaxID=167879 RepID=Q484J4_COLP3|nr:PEP-CTERM sorting domain-containing protein [Colwellia psychrerythraea]AAZ26471.1 hypothetical protein CPS_1790 [Colwellia psychrerythraea 34H]